MKKKLTSAILVFALAIALCACGSARTDTPASTAAPTAAQPPAPTPTPTEAPSPAPTEPPVPSPSEATTDEIRPEFKAFMDSYEAFIDQYCNFMQSYLNGSLSTEMLTQYFSILSSYAEFAEQIAAIDESELTNAELAYYIGVTSRVSQRLLQFAG